MRIIILIMAIVAFPVFSVSGQQGGISNGLTAIEKLKEISISKMEDASFWDSSFSSDNGLMQLRSFEGGSVEKEPVSQEQSIANIEEDKNVLGAKVYFFRRGVMNFSVYPIRPIPVEGITKTISVWVAGRNKEHELELLLLDNDNNHVVLPMGKLNFSGWKKLTVTIPPNIKQRNYSYENRSGLQIAGFNIECDIDETYGRYYIYFDDIRAVTDLFSEDDLLKDDIPDSW